MKEVLEDTRQLSTVKRVLVALMWVVVLPVLMGGVSIPIFSIAYAIAGNPMQPGTYLGIVCVGLVSACLVLIKVLRMKRHLRPVRSIGASIMKFYTIIGSLLLVGIVFGSMNLIGQEAYVDGAQNTQIAEGVLVPQLSREASIDSVLQKIGADPRETVKFGTSYVPTYPIEGKEGEYQIYINPTTGKYLYGMMSIKSGLDANNTHSTIAHEYLHHIWAAVLDEPTKVKLTSDLITMYGNDSHAKNRARWYSDSQMLQPSELFSIYCTESTDSYLSGFVLEQCNKYIDRNSFLMLR